MANTYHSVILHIIFAVKHRQHLLPKEQLRRIHSYMRSYLTNMGQTPIAIGGTDNHVHLLLKYNMKIMIPNVVRDLKVSTTKFINGLRLSQYDFQWQKGYACFSYSESQVEKLKTYVLNQAIHHQKMTFRDELRRFFDLYDIAYDERYMFADPD